MRTGYGYHIEPHATKYRSENVGFVFQSLNLLKDLSVEENITLPLILQELPKAKIEEKVNKVIDLMGLDGWKGFLLRCPLYILCLL